MAFEPELDRRLAEQMRAAQEGDRAAYHALLMDVSRLLAGFLMKRLRSTEAVEDLTQEILLSIHASRHTYDPEKPFAPWMYAIARNRLADFWRRHLNRMRQEVVLDEAVVDGSVPSSVVDSALQDRLSSAMSDLSEPQQRILRMLKVEGFSVRETAAQLNMSETAVKVAAHRAYKRLKARFLAEAYEDA